jgi:hypothetical protein
MDNNQISKVTCSKCRTQFPANQNLTESQRQNFVCTPCATNPVVENQVQDRELVKNGAKVLTEDLPNLG